MTRNTLLARIHIGKKALGLDDETYRDVLERVTGQRSSAGLNDAKRQKVIDELVRLGWKNALKRRPQSKKRYVRKIFALWGALKRDGIWRDKRTQSLIKFVRDMTGVDDPEWLEYHQASKVIEALKKMQERGKL
jgi:phage gp16-like protein